jgi:hypothetical protein
MHKLMVKRKASIALRRAPSERIVVCLFSSPTTRRHSTNGLMRKIDEEHTRQLYWPYAPWGSKNSPERSRHNERCLCAGTAAPANNVRGTSDLHCTSA